MYVSEEWNCLGPSLKINYHRFFFPSFFFPRSKTPVFPKSGLCATSVYKLLKADSR